ncbi:MAG: WbqC family protein [Candidatus Omnitrophica bacterium]|nr:WbqC family protein [Candidatus Omnitrophota bacterium]
MILSVHQPHYIPWLGYFDKISKSDCFVFLDLVQYKPREFQNRNKIRSKNGWIWLTVPVITSGKGRQKIYDVVIDNTLPWTKKHLLALKSCYGKAEFFKRYFPFFEDTYSRNWTRLTDLNVHIINYILGELSISKSIYFESQLETHYTGTDRIIELCQRLNADTYLSGVGGKDYLEEEKFAKAGIRLIYQNFTHPVYKQQFAENKDDFIPYLSIIDLLFNEGPNSYKILKLDKLTNNKQNVEV